MLFIFWQNEKSQNIYIFFFYSVKSYMLNRKSQTHGGVYFDFFYSTKNNNWYQLIQLNLTY